MRRTCLLILLLTSPLPVFANQKSADDCASKLPKDSAAIYSNTVAQISPGANIKDLVVEITRGLVMDGRLSRANARPAAEAAGNCLKLIRK